MITRLTWGAQESDDLHKALLSPKKSNPHPKQNKMGPLPV